MLIPTFQTSTRFQSCKAQSERVSRIRTEWSLVNNTRIQLPSPDDPLEPSSRLRMCVHLYVYVYIFKPQLRLSSTHLLVTTPTTLIPPLPSELTPKRRPLILLNQRLRVRIWINRHRVQWVQLTCSVEQIFIYFPIEATQTAIQLPIWELPCVNQSDGVRSYLFQQLHDSLSSSKLNLSDCDGARGEKFRCFLFKGMKCMEAEEFVHQCNSLAIKLRIHALGAEGVVKVLDN